MLNLRSIKPLSYFSKIWFLWGLSLVLNIITFLFIYYKIKPSGKVVALHYNILVGVDWYGKGWNLYLIPAVGLIICAVNFILYKAFKNSGNFLSFLTVFTSLCVEIVLLAAVLFLSTVN